MASSFPVRRIPAMFVRRQPRVINTTRRLNSSSSAQTQNPSYPLYPSVIQLLREKGIPESEVSKIPASGPKGRLLKGDVLAYVGAIPADYPPTQASRINKLSHLDLSNVKIAAPPKPAEPKAPVVEERIARPPPTVSVAISVPLATVLSSQKKIKETLGVTVPLSTFLACATDLANDDLPRSPHTKPSADELFDEILGAEPIKTSRGDYVPELNAFKAVEVTPAQAHKEDIIDILSGRVSKKAPRAPSMEDTPAGSATNVFSLTVPVGDENRARVFLDRMKTLLTIEPARLVL